MGNILGVIIGILLLVLFAVCVIVPEVGIAIASTIWNGIVWLFTSGH